MRSLGIDAILPWEIGILFILIGVLLIYIGNRQSKKTDIDLNELPLIETNCKNNSWRSNNFFIGVIQLFCIIKIDVKLFDVMRLLE